MILLCTSVFLLFISIVKCYNVYRCSDVQNAATHLVEQFLGISSKITNQLLYKKLILESYFKLLTSDISLKSDQCHSKVEKSGGQTMGQNTEKSDFFSVISTNLTKTRDRGAY